MTPRSVVPVLLLIVLHAADARLSAQPAKVIRRTIASTALGSAQDVEVHLPANYDLATRQYPVVYLFDADLSAITSLTVAATAFDLKLDALDRPMPPQIVVGIYQKDRGRQFGKESEAYATFVRKELVPAIEKEFRASPMRILVGHSLAGAFALQLVCADRMFAAVVAISPAISDVELPPLTSCLRRRFNADSGRLTQIVFSTGSRQGDRTEEQFRPQHLRLSKCLSDSAPASVRWRHISVERASHSQTPYFTIPAALWFIHDRDVWDLPMSTYDSVFKGKADFDLAMTQFTKVRDVRMGFATPPDPSWLRLSRAMKKPGEAASVAARRAVAASPEDLDDRLALVDALIATGDSTSARRELANAERIATLGVGSGDQEQRLAEVRKRALLVGRGPR